MLFRSTTKGLQPSYKRLHSPSPLSPSILALAGFTPPLHPSKKLHHDPHPGLSTNPDYNYEVGTEVNFMGARFVWSENHISAAELNVRRMVGDDLADNAINEVLNYMNSASGEDGKRFNESGLDYYNLVQTHSISHPTSFCAKFINEINTPIPHGTIPFDHATILSAQKTFTRNLTSCSLPLLYLSLVGGFSSPKINHLLNKTNYITSSNPLIVRNRLIETTKMIVDCMTGGVDSLLPGGLGWISCVKVRLLHSFVRRSLRRRGWDDVKDGGAPINQCDLSVTALSFSINIIFGLEALGLPFTLTESENHIYIWRYISHIMGVLPVYNVHTSLKQSITALESKTLHCLAPCESSLNATNNLINSLVNYPNTKWTFNKHACLSRCMMGDIMADSMGLPKTGFWDNLFLWRLCMILKVFTACSGYWSDYWEERNERVVRKMLDVTVGKAKGKANAKEGEEEEVEEAKDNFNFTGTKMEAVYFKPIVLSKKIDIFWFVLYFVMTVIAAACGGVVYKILGWVWGGAKGLFIEG